MMKADIDLRNIYIRSGGVTASINYDQLRQRIRTAQYIFGENVLHECRSMMPMRTGSLQQRSHTEEDGRKVVFPGPYARYLYGGVAMVDSATGRGPMKIEIAPGTFILRYRKGARLRPTDRPLRYSSKTAVSHWFDAAKQKYKDYWIQMAANAMGGRVK